jgi:DNA-binding transcriptional MocR family regulator
VWARLPDGADAGAFAQVALRHGVAIVPGRLLSVTGLSRSFVRLAFTPPPEQLKVAVEGLAAAWESSR